MALIFFCVNAFKTMAADAPLGPLVKTILVDKKIRAGEVGRIYLQIENRGADLPPFLNLCENAYLVSRDLKIEEGITAVCGNFIHVGNQGYTLDIAVAASVPSGFYAIIFESTKIIFDQNRTPATGPLQILQFEVFR